MNLNHDRKLITLLFNPFVYIAGAQALGLGLAAVLLAGLVGSLSHTHFDGVLDTHMGLRAPLGVFLAEGFIDWLCLGVVLLVMGKIISGTSFRIIDLFGTQALARWPTVFTSLLALPGGMRRFTYELLQMLTKPGAKIEFNSTDAIEFLVVTLAMIPLLCWMVALMYKSYSVSCNVKGGKAIGTFIAGLFVAEILSKIAVYGLFKLI